MIVLTKEEEVKHSIILLHDVASKLFEKLKSENFTKKKAIEVEFALLKLIGIVATGVFKDYKEYRFYCEAVQKDIADQFKKYSGENE